MSRIAELLELLKAEPLDSFLNYVLALEYAKENQQKKAIALLEEILLRDGDYLGAYYQLGQLYEQVLVPEKARNAYLRGIEVAKRQKNIKTAGELNTALESL